MREMFYGTLMSGIAITSDETNDTSMELKTPSFDPTERKLSFLLPRCRESSTFCQLWTRSLAKALLFAFLSLPANQLNMNMNKFFCEIKLTDEPWAKEQLIRF